MWRNLQKFKFRDSNSSKLQPSNHLCYFFPLSWYGSFALQRHRFVFCPMATKMAFGPPTFISFPVSVILYSIVTFVLISFFLLTFLLTFYWLEDLKCPSLCAKPKWFIIQACRGGKFDNGCHVDQLDLSYKLPELSGVLFKLPNKGLCLSSLLATYWTVTRKTSF